MGILLLPAQRGDKTPYGSTRKLVEEEIQDLYPTIDLPVTIVLFDLLGKPEESQEVEVQSEGQQKEAATRSETSLEQVKVERQEPPETPSPEGLEATGTSPSETNPSTKQDKPKRKRRPKPPSTN